MFSLGLLATLMNGALNAAVGAAAVGLVIWAATWLWNAVAEGSKSVRSDVERALGKEIAEGSETGVVFDDFPYHLSDQVKNLLVQVGFFCFNPARCSEHVNTLLPRRQAILLSAPSELYMQMVAKALSKHLGSNLLVFDINRLKFKVRCKNGCSDKTGYFSDLFEAIQVIYELFDQRVPRKNTAHWCFSEKVLIESLQKVLLSNSKAKPIILYVRDVEELLKRSTKMYLLFRQMLDNLSRRQIVIIGSRLVKHDTEKLKSRISHLFPYNVEIEPPQGESNLAIWRRQMEKDEKTIKIQDNRSRLSDVLAANNLNCDDLDSVCLPDMVLEPHMKNIVLAAVAQRLYEKYPKYRNGKLVIPSTSLSQLARKVQNSQSDLEKKNVVPENKHERTINSELITPNQIDVTFNDIGAMDDTKELLQELVMLPLRRPELFKTGLLKPCRGILLFGPPGTGKTMLAKAIAKESGACFISVSASAITSMWYGEAEKNVKALFTLAAKAAPTIIFVDEVDSILTSRNDQHESNVSRRVKNEFMTHWDGLLTKSGQRILLLGATNRPFDLDEAVIRRFERRIMVGLPSKENRELILKKLLSKENVEGVDYRELAAMTEGYTGSDLKNLCVTAAYCPVRELLKKETEKNMEERMEKTDKENMTLIEEPTISLRPVNMEDLRRAKDQIAASFASESAAMNQMVQWNELYGEGGSRKNKEQLSYFL